MKQFNTAFSFLLLLLLGGSAFAQNRYLTPIFSEVQVTEGLKYGSNVTILFLAAPEIQDLVTEDLLFDFYEPVGDTVSERPLVILVKTGNFLPIAVNGTVQGTRTDSVNVEIATRLAKAGYAVAAIDYRLGWNPLAPSQPERALQLIQAAYRGVQDTRTAIRYFKKDYVENDNSYSIDTSRITLWGIGTGGYITLGTTGLTDFNKVITTTNPAGKFLYDPFMTGTPNVPMVNVQANGDIYGTSLGVLPIDSPPLSAGDTLCIPNHVGYSSNFQLTVNQAGALGDISWLDEATPQPIIGFQSPTDPFAPYKDAILTVPTTGDPIVQVQGSFTSVEKANMLGNNSVFDGVENMFPNYPYVATITQAARDASTKAGDTYIEGLFPFNLPTNNFGNEEGDPWNWWEPAIWSTIPNTVAAPDSSVTYEQTARLNNETASAERGRRYVDSLMWYFLPRAFMALNLDMATNVNELITSNQVELSISPNPASSFVRFQTAAEFPMQHILVYDMGGRLVQSRTNINASFAEIQKGSLPPGTYVAYVRFEEGIVAQKILFR